MKRWWVEYINFNGNQSRKSFDSEEAAMAFSEVLDKRIAKGVCGGYMITPVDINYRQRINRDWLTDEVRATVYGK